MYDLRGLALPIISATIYLRVARRGSIITNVIRLHGANIRTAGEKNGRLTTASALIFAASWLCFMIGIVAAVYIWATTPETGTERELAAVIMFGLFGWPAFVVAFVQFVYGLIVFSDVGKPWSFLNVINPVVIVIMPFVLSAALGLGPN